MMKKALVLPVVAITTLFLAGCAGSAGSASNGPTVLQKATENCLQSGSKGWELQDEGRSVQLQVRGLSMEGLAGDEADCVLKEAGAPDSVLTKIGHTGHGSEQTASWDGFEASWTFEIFAGTAITVKEKK
jgi:hypothetical protein